MNTRYLDDISPEAWVEAARRDLDEALADFASAVRLADNHLYSWYSATEEKQRRQERLKECEDRIRTLFAAALAPAPRL